VTLAIEQERLLGELASLLTAFKQNGYSDRQIRRVLNPPHRQKTPR